MAILHVWMSADYIHTYQQCRLMQHKACILSKKHKVCKIGIEKFHHTLVFQTPVAKQ